MVFHILRGDPGAEQGTEVYVVLHLTLDRAARPPASAVVQGWTFRRQCWRCHRACSEIRSRFWRLTRKLD